MERGTKFMTGWAHPVVPAFLLFRWPPGWACRWVWASRCRLSLVGRGLEPCSVRVQMTRNCSPGLGGGLGIKSRSVGGWGGRVSPPRFTIWVGVVPVALRVFRTYAAGCALTLVRLDFGHMYFPSPPRLTNL